MRTTSLKTIYLTIPELKEAVAGYIHDKQGELGTADLYEHWMSNEWSMDWAPKSDELSISIDGEIKDNKGSFTIESEE